MEALLNHPGITAALLEALGEKNGHVVGCFFFFCFCLLAHFFKNSSQMANLGLGDIPILFVDFGTDKFSTKCGPSDSRIHRRNTSEYQKHMKLFFFFGNIL